MPGPPTFTTAERRHPVESPERTPRRPLRALVSLMSLCIMVAGCSSQVERGADERAERAGTVMHRERHGTAADMALRVVGGNPEDGTAIEALVAEGERFGGRIVLRITERLDDGGDFDIRDPDAVRCYEYDLTDGYNFDPNRIDCPDLDALQLEPSAPEPAIPSGAADALRERLEALDPGSLNEEQVLAVARQAGADAAIVDVATAGGVIGVVIGNGGDQCVAASVDAGTVEVWHIPKVLAQPGELGCSALAAARGEGKRHPH